MMMMMTVHATHITSRFGFCSGSGTTEVLFGSVRVRFFPSLVTLASVTFIFNMLLSYGFYSKT